MDQTVNQGAFNNLNQLTSRSGGGQLQVEGEINEPGTVTIQSQAMTNSRPATVDANGVFSGKATVAPGSNTLTIVATDASGNARTRQYGVTVDGLTASQSFGYDDNGNMTSRPGTTYHWDAENRLIKIEYVGEGQTEFSYDGFSRRVKAVEKNAGGTVTSEKRWIWCGGAQPSEERDAANKVTKRYFGYGLQTVDVSDVTTNFFTMRDHLGSVRELVDSTGAVRARYDYDPYGRRTKISGDLNAEFGYTGHYFHERSGLNLAPYRAYDANLGRWLSRDPIEEDGGLNLYGYVANNPINYWDPLGLELSPHDAARLGQYANPGQINGSYGSGLGAFQNGGISGGQEFFSSEPRYAYHPELGWIDLQHVAAASWITGNSFPLAGQLLGYGNECSQWVNQFNPFRSPEERADFAESGMSFEDLLSNAIGDRAGADGRLPWPMSQTVDQGVAHMMINPADSMRMTPPGLR